MKTVRHCSLTAAVIAIPELPVSYSATCCSVTSISEEEHNKYKRNTALKLKYFYHIVR